jgi:hypothetical protein
MTDTDSHAVEADRRQRVTQLAHEIWEAEGRPEGQSLRHWGMAERLVEAEDRYAREQQSGSWSG